MLSRSRSKITREIESLKTLKWNSNAIANLTLSKKKFEKFEKLHLEMNPIRFVFFIQEDVEIAQKTRLFITFTSLIQME